MKTIGIIGSRRRASKSEQELIEDNKLILILPEKFNFEAELAALDL